MKLQVWADESSTTPITTPHHSTTPTFQTMHHNVQSSLHQQLLQLLGPDALRVERGERLDLVLVGHGADDARDIFGLWRDGFELRDDRVDLGDGELRPAGADVDLLDGVGGLVGGGAEDDGGHCGGVGILVVMN